VSHVLVTRLDSDGDVLLAGPALRAVAAGAERVTLLCGPRGRQAAALLPGVDEIVEWRAPWIDPEPPRDWHGAVARDALGGLVERIGRLGADRALILGSFHQSPLPTALALRLAGVPWIGATCVDYPGALLDLRHPDAGDVHEVERSLGLVRAAGYELPAGDDGRLRIAAAARVPTAAPYVAVHPGASVPARSWSPGRWAELVCALSAAGRRVVVTGAPSEAELTARVAGLPRPGVTDLGGATSLPALAGVLAGADAVAVGNTGPAHLAAAVGTPVVSLFAPTVPAARWRPWGVPHELLNVDVPCAGCRARACPVPGHPCLEGVTASDALAAVERLVPARELEAVA
jgi:ADP-heptose:LPS heptosyltransferase